MGWRKTPGLKAGERLTEAGGRYVEQGDLLRGAGREAAHLYALRGSTVAEGTVWEAIWMWAVNQSKLMGTSSRLLGALIPVPTCLCLLPQQWDWCVWGEVESAFPY